MAEAGVQGAAQAAVSLVNQRRGQNGSPSGIGNLVGLSAQTMNQALSGSDPTARGQLATAAGESMKNAAMFGGMQSAANYLLTNRLKSLSVKRETESLIPIKFSEQTPENIAIIASEYRRRAPVVIPDVAKYKTQSKAKGYEQIVYTWQEEECRYEARWHTRTPGAPREQSESWVISKIIPGDANGKRRRSYILVGEEWITQKEWQMAIYAYQNNCADERQMQILQRGHQKSGERR